MGDENKKKEEQVVENPATNATDNNEQETPATPVTPVTQNTQEQPAQETENKAMRQLIGDQRIERAQNSVAYDTQIQNVNDFISEVNTKKQELNAQDQEYQKRENAYRYIAGIGDAISGVANLVGVAEGNAANQEQTYNAPAVIQKAEQSRKERKLEMDKLNERLDEMKARGKDLRAAKDLKTAELNAQQAKERRTLETQQAATERENYWKQKSHEIDAINAAANLARANAAETNAETNANKPPKTTKPGEEYSFTVVGGDTISIPAHKWNESTLIAAYNAIPENQKTRRVKMTRDIAGNSVQAKDDAGNYIYEKPSRDEMLADVIKAAQNEQDVANVLRSYAKGSGANSDKYQ